MSEKRNLHEVMAWEERRDEASGRATTTTRVRSALLKPFAEVPAVKSWLSLFSAELDRYPFLVVLAPPRAGKTEWAKSRSNRPLVLPVDDLDHLPGGMRQFNRKHHHVIVLDGLMTLLLLCAPPREIARQG